MQHGSKRPQVVVERTVTTDEKGNVSGKKVVEREFRYQSEDKQTDLLAVMMISALGGAFVALATFRLAAFMQ